MASGREDNVVIALHALIAAVETLTPGTPAASAVVPATEQMRRALAAAGYHITDAPVVAAPEP